MKNWLFVAGVNGALAVLAGAFAAHALGSRLDPRLLSAFSTAATYHLVHSLALGVAGLAAQKTIMGAARRRADIAAALFLAGIVLFCFSLYLLALTGIIAFAYATPVGGIAFIAGWIMLAAAGLKMERS